MWASHSPASQFHSSLPLSEWSKGEWQRAKHWIVSPPNSYVDALTLMWLYLELGLLGDIKLNEVIGWGPNLIRFIVYKKRKTELFLYCTHQGKAIWLLSEVLIDWCEWHSLRVCPMKMQEPTSPEISVCFSVTVPAPNPQHFAENLSPLFAFLPKSLFRALRKQHIHKARLSEEIKNQLERFM